jgi:two-component system, chemotaxis family, chemotaxis protein CheY
VNKLILIVEDDQDAAMMMSEVLEGEGYRTVTAFNGAEALEILNESERPALILLDMTMPVMDGWGFREMQLNQPEIASIPVVTATADGDAKGKATKLAAAGWLAKPLSIDRLLAEVERVCGAP